MVNMMNDFTKEELTILNDTILLHEKALLVIGEYEASKEAYLLKQKVQSMIDNYCDHKNQYTGSGTFLYCDDCDKVFI